MRIKTLFWTITIAASMTACSSGTKSSEESAKQDSATEAVAETEPGTEADFEGEPDSDSDFLDIERLTKLYTADQRHLSEDDKEFLLQQYDIAMREMNGIDGKKDPEAFRKKLKELGREESGAVLAAITLTESQAQDGRFSEIQMTRYKETKAFYTAQ